MARSLVVEVTEPTVFVSEVAKRHDLFDVFVRAIAPGVLVTARASFLMDKTIRKLLECFNEDLLKLALIPPIVVLEYPK